MPSSSTISFSLAALLAIGAPLTVMWRAQKRAAETTPVPVTELRVEGMAFNGFPYLRVPVDKLKTRRPVVAFEELVRQNTAEFGPTHADTLISRNNLANALLADGRYDDAEVVQRALLADMKKVLPEDHPDTFRCQFNLALNLRMQGMLPEARTEMELVYAGWVNVLGEKHPRTQEALLVLENLRGPAVPPVE